MNIKRGFWMYMIVLEIEETIEIVGKGDGDIMKFDTVESAEYFAKMNLGYNYRIVKIPMVGMAG